MSQSGGLGSSKIDAVPTKSPEVEDDKVVFTG